MHFLMPGGGDIVREGTVAPRMLCPRWGVETLFLLVGNAKHLHTVECPVVSAQKSLSQGRLCETC